MQVRSSIKPLSYTRFSVTPTCLGFEVSDQDGRPVTEPFESEHHARLAAANLNDAAASGPKSLALALGAVDEWALSPDEEVEEAA